MLVFSINHPILLCSLKRSLHHLNIIPKKHFRTQKLKILTATRLTSVGNEINNIHVSNKSDFIPQNTH